MFGQALAIRWPETRLSDEDEEEEQMTETPVRKRKYGHLPKMAVASKDMMGSLMASSFCERINSCSNLVYTKNNSLLSDDEIDMVVTLRMNRDFMKHMRLNYPEVIKSTHPRYGTIVSAQDLLDQNTKNNEDDEDLY